VAPCWGGSGEIRMYEGLGRTARHRVEPPVEFAGLHVVCREKAANRVLAAADADDDPSTLDDARRHRDGVRHVFGRHPRFPENLAGCGIECSESSVDDRRYDFALIQRDAAIHHAAADPGLPDLLIHFRIDSPEFFVCAQVDRVGDAPRRNSIHYAVEYERRLFLVSLRSVPRRNRYLSGPCDAEPAYVGRIDLFQRAVPLLRPVHAVSNPLISGLASGLERGVVYLTLLLSRNHRCREDDHPNHKSKLQIIAHFEHPLSSKTVDET